MILAAVALALAALLAFAVWLDRSRNVAWAHSLASAVCASGWAVLIFLYAQGVR